MSFNICDNNHEEIVIDGHNCPLCDAILERDQALATITELEEELKDERGTNMTYSEHLEEIKRD